MISPLASVGAWLASYLLHSSLLIILAFALIRFGLIQSRRTVDLVWKAALIGGLLTSSLQFLGNVQPGGDLNLSTYLKPVVGLVAPPTMVVTENTETVTHEPAISLLQNAGYLFMWMWPVLSLLFFARVIWEHRRFLASLRDRSMVRNPQVLSVFKRCLQRSGLTENIKLSSSERLPGPVVLNMREICMPQRALTQLDPDQQACMFAHELAHIKRRDPLMLRFCALLEALFPFQLLNGFARKRMQANAEFLCDHQAVLQSKSGLNMATCLAQVASWLKDRPSPLTVPAMADDASLVHRVSEILNRNQTGHFAKPRKAIVLVGALLIGSLLLLLPAASFAPKPPKGNYRHANILTEDYQTFHVNVDSREVVGDRTIETRVKGRFQFGPNFEPIHLHDGSYIELTDRVNGEAHWFRLSPDDNGHPVLSYKINGSPQTPDNAYFQFLYREMIRESYLFGPQYGELVLESEGRAALEKELEITRFSEARSSIIEILDRN